MKESSDAHNQLLAEMDRVHLTPTWVYAPKLVPKEPPVSYKPYLWKWDLLYRILLQAGELVSIERGGERRSMEVVNPALKDRHATTHTLGAALQLVKPGEIAPPHRHTAGAIRFIVKGRGAYTAVQGEKLFMEEGDLILTPRWMWHDHGNETEEPIVWLDALDYPFVNLLQASFFEPFPEPKQPITKPIGFTEERVGLARPAWERYPEDVPLVTYRWRDTYRALTALSESEGSSVDGVILEYVNPFRQGPVLPTMACLIQLLRPGEHTKAHRHTSSAVYFVVKGSGQSIMDGERFDWGTGDFFLTPPWAWHEHANPTKEESILFVMSDKPVLDAFGYYREEAYAENGHRQPVTKIFTPER